KSVLENSFESLIGAVFLDGGIEPARQVAGKLLIDVVESVQEEIANGDYKSHLQEKLQAEGNADIVYLTYGTQGPPHDTVFFVRLCIGGKAVSEGQGKTKKQAEQDAAKNAIHNLK
ncbi:MAG: putative dsRNA-binding protein, partial [Eubacteriales bacterium]